jgi:hypothetical protein
MFEDREHPPPSTKPVEERDPDGETRTRLTRRRTSKPQPPPAVVVPPKRTRPTARATRNAACREHVVAT